MKDKSYIKDVKRLNEVLSFNIIGSDPEKEFDDLALLASIICETPVALISMIDAEKQWHKAKLGVEDRETKIEDTICQHTILQEDLLEIEDASIDERTKSNPNVTKKDGVRFYAGQPLISQEGEAIGTLCVVDSKPKKLKPQQKQALSIIADQALGLLEKKKKNDILIDELSGVLKKKIEEKKKELAQIEKEYNRLFEAIEKSSLVVTFSPKGDILFANDNFLEVFGYKKEELEGKSHDFLLDVEDGLKMETFWTSLSSGQFKSGKFKRKHKDGSTIWLQSSYNPILNTKGEVTKVIKVAQNVTLEVKAKKEVDQLNIQKDHFIANMSHEIRTPINAIMGFTELLREEETDPEKKQHLDSVKVASDNLLYLVNDILDLSKIEAGLFKIDSQEFDLLHAIKNVFRTLQLKAQLKDIVLDYSLDQQVHLQVIGDKNRLIQILINLIGNAIKFTHKGFVKLEVQLHDESEFQQVLSFSVKDTGIGIPQEKLTHIFERFSQASEDTTRNFGGTGLGLNIAKQLVNLQGGNIHVESEPDKGTTFEFTLPYKKAKLNLKFNEDKTIPEVKMEKALKLLVCEDNQLNQKLISSIFKTTPYSVKIVDNGKQGIDALKAEAFDLVLMDLQMPEIDGYQATKIIREELKLSIPIIALTAHSMIAELERCKALGMNDYLSKPFKKNTLFMLIEKWTPHVKNKQDLEEYLLDYSLTPLKEMVGDDEAFQKEMIDLFIKQTNEAIEEFQHCLKDKNKNEIKSLAHKLKTSYGMLAIDTSLLEQIEDLAGQEKEETEKLSEPIQRLKKQIELISEKLSKLI